MKARFYSLVAPVLLLLLMAAFLVAPPPASAQTQLRALSDEVAAISAKVRPAVVSVQSTVMRKVPSMPGLEDFEKMLPPGLREQLGPNLNFHNKDREYEQRGLGSGFIVDPSGLIYTNNHVVADPETGKPLENIKVILNDGREFPAKILGNDPETEVALVKIEASNLPYIELGNSDSLKVGNFVLAVGSPQGIEFA